jgi:hypothetical protein
MIVITSGALDALTTKLNSFTAGYRPIRIGIWTTNVGGEHGNAPLAREMTGVTFFFDDQRDGKYEQRYLIGEGGMVRIPD